MIEVRSFPQQTRKEPTGGDVVIDVKSMRIKFHGLRDRHKAESQS